MRRPLFLVLLLTACGRGTPSSGRALPQPSACVSPDVLEICPKPSEPCQVATCDAITGCGTAALPDGTACGPASCTAEPTCESGRCVATTPPDGFLCAPATPCQGAGTCQRGACVRPPVVPMEPAWTIAPQAGYRLASIGVADPEGNVYWSEWYLGDAGYFSTLLDGGENATLASATSDGALRYRLPTSLGDVVGWAQGLLLSSGVFSRHMEARDSASGAVVWTIDSVGDAGFGQGFGVVDLPRGDLALLLNTTGWGPGYVAQVDPLTGAARWWVELPENVAGAMPGAEGSVFVVSANIRGWTSSRRITRDGKAGPAPDMFMRAEAAGRTYDSSPYLYLDGGICEEDLPGWPHGQSWPARLTSDAGPLSALRNSQGQVVSLWADPQGGDLSGVVMDGRMGFKLYGHAQYISSDGGEIYTWGVAGFDPSSGPSRWSSPWQGGSVTSYALTNHDTLAFEHADARGAASFSEVDESGKPLYDCPIANPGASWGTLKAGYWTVAEGLADGGQRIAGYAFPGLDEASSGWTTDRGNMSRSNVPR